MEHFSNINLTNQNMYRDSTNRFCLIPPEGNWDDRNKYYDTTTDSFDKCKELCTNDTNCKAYI